MQRKLPQGLLEYDILQIGEFFWSFADGSLVVPTVRGNFRPWLIFQRRHADTPRLMLLFRIIDIGSRTLFLSRLNLASGKESDHGKSISFGREREGCGIMLVS